MNIDEFYVFYDTRPDGERWELIDGELVLKHGGFFGHCVMDRFRLCGTFLQDGGNWFHPVADGPGGASGGSPWPMIVDASGDWWSYVVLPRDDERPAVRR